MESTIDFFRFRAREDFIALFQGATPLLMLSPRAASVNRFRGEKWHGRPARDHTRKMRVP